MKEIYFNHAGTSWPKPEVVVTAMHEAAQAAPSSWAARFESAHRTVADFFSVADPASILLTPGCTSALSVAISDVFLGDKKRVLTSRWEHHALHRPLLKLASEGIILDYIPTFTSAEGSVQTIDLDALESTLAVGDVGLIAITAACNVTGALLPFNQVIEMAHQHEVMVMLDAAQLVGWQDLNLPQLGADLVAFGGHKGLQGPWGIGGLYIGPNARMHCLSANCSLPSTGGGSVRPRPGYCDVGSVDQIALAALAAALWYLKQRDTAASLDAACQQISRINVALQNLERVKVYSEAARTHENLTDPATRSGLPCLAFEVEGVSSPVVAASLAKYGITIGSGLHCAPLAHETLGTSQNGLCRISVGIAQREEDIEHALGILPEAICKL